MIDKTILRLMNQELDGANSAADSAALRNALVAGREARERFEELRAAADLVRRAEGPAPAPDFKDGILAAIRRRSEPVGDKRPQMPAVLSPLRLKYALFFGLGLGLGLFLLVVFRNRAVDAGFDARQLVGTVVEARLLRPAGDLRFDQGVVSQDLHLRFGDGCLLAEVQGQAAQDVDMVWAYDRDRLSFDALRQSKGDQGGVTIEPGRLEVRTAGSHGYVIAFVVKRGLPLSLDYRVSSAGAVIFEKTLAVTPEGVR
jgi:hypothetical protein